MDPLKLLAIGLLVWTGCATVRGLPSAATSYKVTDQWGQQSGLPGESVSGFYAWQNGETQVRVEYIADKNGYRPVVQITSGAAEPSSQYAESSSKGSELTQSDVDRFIRIWEEFSQFDPNVTRVSNSSYLEKPILIIKPSGRFIIPLLFNLFTNKPTMPLGSITQSDVQQAERNWASKIVQMGRVKDNPAALDRAAEDALNLYAWDRGPVLFKPTKASDNQFRLTREAAKSYFIGKNSNYPEDEGFALEPWINVRFDNAGYILDKNRALAMGNYYFMNQDRVETKVEYTFGFVRPFLGGLKIELQHSSLPYKKPDAVLVN